MKVYQKINLNFDPIDELNFEYDWMHDLKEPWPLETVQPDQMGPKLTEFLKKLNLEPVDRSCFFIGHPLTIQTIHTDVMKGWALNFVRNWEDTTMKWYALKNTDLNPPIQLTRAGTNYQSYSLDNLKLIDSASFQCALVKIDVPHQVINRSRDKYRYCYSVRVKPMIEWDHVLDLFKPWTID